MKQSVASKLACFSDESDDPSTGHQRFGHYLKTLHTKIQKMQHVHLQKLTKNEYFMTYNPPATTTMQGAMPPPVGSNNQMNQHANSYQQSESPRHSTEKNSHLAMGVSCNSSEFERSNAILSFNQKTGGGIYSNTRNTEEKLADKQEHNYLTKKDINYMINSYEYFHHNVVKPLGKLGDNFWCNYRNMNLRELENNLLKNVQQIQCCLYQFFEFKRIREKRNRNDLFRQCMKLLLLR